MAIEILLIDFLALIIGAIYCFFVIKYFSITNQIKICILTLIFLCIIAFLIS